MIVTTSYSPDYNLIERACALAFRYKGLYLPRERFNLSTLQSSDMEKCLLLVTQHTLLLYLEQDKPFFFHPSMALLRVKQLLRGENDPLLNYGRVVRGDSVLDCTAGMGADAIVFSYLVGTNGKVIALESEYLLSMMIHEGLNQYVTNLGECDFAMRQIQVCHAHHLNYMQQLPAKSIDIVYFDPMFRRPQQGSASLAPIRNLANHEPLSLDAIAEAKRIARKRIILKESRNSGEFERLGIPIVSQNNSIISYGVIELGFNND